MWLFQHLFCSSCCSTHFATWRWAHGHEQVCWGEKEETSLSELNTAWEFLASSREDSTKDKQTQTKPPLLETSNLKINYLSNLKGTVWLEYFLNNPVYRWVKALITRDVFSSFCISLNPQILHSLPQIFSSPHLDMCISKEIGLSLRYEENFQHVLPKKQTKIHCDREHLHNSENLWGSAQAIPAAFQTSVTAVKKF